MFDYNLSLAAGTDIPIEECKLILHQPIVRDIAMIGEDNFYTGLQLLCISKELVIDDPEALKEIENFDVFINFILQPQVLDKKNSVLKILQLLFPDYNVFFTPRSIVFNRDEVNLIIDRENFQYLQQVLNKTFCLEKTDQSAFNPSGPAAKKIAEKLMKARKKVAEQKSDGGSSISQYVSVLSVGISSMSLADCLNLTLYQLYDLIERYILYVNWDMDVKTRLAGGSSDKPVDNWMKRIH